MRIGVTGATGFVGQSVLKELTNRGHQAVPLVRGLSNLDSERVIGDIGASGDLSAAVADLDVIVHAAARCHVMRESDPNPREAFDRVNVIGTERIARAAAKACVKRLVYISSIKVNGETTLPGRPFRFDDPPKPIGNYAISKLKAERALAIVQRDTGLETVVIRPVLVYGPGVRANFAALVNAVRRRVPLPLARVHNRRSMIFVANLADLIVTAATHPAAAGRTLLAADPEPLSTPDLIRRVAIALDTRVLLFPVPRWLLARVAAILNRSAMVERLFGSLEVDIEETGNVINWRAPVALDEALKESFGARRDRET